MSGKRNISYVKPQDPSFLAKLKAQIGFKDGPTLETKRQKLDFDDNSTDSEDRPDREEEKPQIVVLQSGDLTAEEVSKEESRIAREAVEIRADLSRPIVFQRRKEKQDCASRTSTSLISENNGSKSATSNNSAAGNKEIDKKELKRTKNKREPQKSKLSFNVDEEDGEI